MCEPLAYLKAAGRTSHRLGVTTSCGRWDGEHGTAQHPSVPYIPHTHWGYDATWAWARALDSVITRGGTIDALFDNRGGARDESKPAHSVRDRHLDVRSAAMARSSGGVLNAR